MPRIASKPAASEGVTSAESERFLADVERLWAEGGRLGLAVSGGPDSLALLLLAHAAMPGDFAVATVNHGLRAEAEAECAMVAGVCAERNIPCAALRVKAGEGNLQAEARKARYEAMAQWAAREGVAALATAHHADDQAETLLMRLNRASGLAGLSGVRARGLVPGSRLPLLRPLLRWRRAELAAIVAGAGLDPVQDPSNANDAYDRARIRKALAGAEWIDPAALAESAAHLAEADEALDWLVAREWDERVSIADGGAIRFEPGVPRAAALRIVARIVEGFGSPARGGAIARLVDGLTSGSGGNVAGVAASVEDEGWLFRSEAPRRS
jgi:tRNA(Ile)-lysidine synthase